MVMDLTHRERVRTVACRPDGVSHASRRRMPLTDSSTSGSGMQLTSWRISAGQNGSASSTQLVVM